MNRPMSIDSAHSRSRGAESHTGGYAYISMNQSVLNNKPVTFAKSFRFLFSLVFFFTVLSYHRIYDGFAVNTAIMMADAV